MVVFYVFKSLKQDLKKNSLMGHQLNFIIIFLRKKSANRILKLIYKKSEKIF